MKVIYTNPANAEILRDHLVDGIPGMTESLFDACFEIHTNAHLPKNKITRRWEPPPNDRFVTYEDRDHEWLKALGFGSYVEVDEGLLFYSMEKPNPFRMMNTITSRRFLHGFTAV